MSITHRSIQDEVNINSTADDADEEQTEDEDEEMRLFYGTEHDQAREDENGGATMLDQEQATMARRTSFSHHRRSSLHDIMNGVATASTSPPTSPTPTASATRPHFLRERSATMIENIPSQRRRSEMRSHASLFLLDLVQRSHATRLAPTTTSGFSRPTSRHGSLTLASSRALSSMNQSFGVSSVNTIIAITHMDSVRNRRGALVTRLSTGSIPTDGVDAKNEATVIKPTIADLVHDLHLYRHNDLSLITLLLEILRTLQNAKQHGERSRLETLCKDVIEAGILGEIVTTMREFRFHSRVQVISLSVLCLLVDVNELYALMMSEIDLEPLVRKLVSVHGSNEALVTMGATLLRAMKDAKSNANVLRLSNERKVEHERQRVASFAKVVAAHFAQTSRVKPHVSPRAKSAPVQVNPVSLPSRGAFSAALGAPPMLTTKYDLECSFQRRKDLPPLPSRHEENKDRDVHERQRPTTSPQSMRTSARAIDGLVAAYGAKPKTAASKRTTKSSCTLAFARTPQSSAIQKKRAESAQVHRNAKLQGKRPKTFCTKLSTPSPKQEERSSLVKLSNDQAERDREDANGTDDDDYEDDFESDQLSNAQEETQEHDGNSDINQEITLISADSDGELIAMIHDHAEDQKSDHEIKNEAVVRGVNGITNNVEEQEDEVRHAQAKAKHDDQSVFPANDTIAIVEMLEAGLAAAPVACTSLLRKRNQPAPTAAKRKAISSGKPIPCSHAGTRKAHSDKNGIGIDIESISSQNNCIDPSQSSSTPFFSPSSPSLESSSALIQIQALYARGLRHHKQNQLNDAIACYQEALQYQQLHAPSREFASIYINLGSAWLVQRKFTEALAALEHAVRIQPTNVKATYNFALALQALERFPDAKHYFERVLTLDPAHQAARRALAHCDNKQQRRSADMEIEAEAEPTPQLNGDENAHQAME